MLQVSLSQLDYSAIGFSKTMTEEFDDLKKSQESLTTRVDGIRQLYLKLVKREEEEVVTQRKGKMRSIFRYRQAISVTPAPT